MAEEDPGSTTDVAKSTVESDDQISVVQEPLPSIRIGEHEATVTTESHLDIVDIDTVKECRQFQDWANSIAKEKRIEITKIHIQSLDIVGTKVGFIKFQADSRVDGHTAPGIVFMRGDAAVAILVILHHEGRKFTLLTRQARVPVCLSSMTEVPTGTFLGAGTLIGDAVKEMEAGGIDIKESELIDLTQLAFKDRYVGVYPSCGGNSECNRIFLCERRLDDKGFEVLNAKLSGAAAESEMIRLQIVPLDALWRICPDAKALAAVCLYEKLIRAGLISDSEAKPLPVASSTSGEISADASTAQVAAITVDSSPEEAKARLQQLVDEAKTQDLPAASLNSSSSSAEGNLPLFQPVRYVQLKVHPDLGAGLSLRPTLWGMIVEDIEPNPGQPGLEKGDYIVEIAKKQLMGLDEAECKQVFGTTFGNGIEIGVATPVEPKRKETSESLLGGSWPEAVQAESEGQWPEATEVQTAGQGARPRATTAPTGGYPASSGGTTSASPEPACGLLDLVDQLSQQLTNETMRRDAEEAELEERRQDEKRLREELQAKRQRRSDVLAAAEAAAKAAEETQRQHAELAETHERTKAEVEQHEKELNELRAAAKARTGRDWARDGPEKDELVKTKLSIAEAHDRLAHVRLQLRLNRDGLRLQLRTLQEENDRLRGSLSSSAART